MPEIYTVDEEQKKQFASAYLLEKMVNTPMSIPLFLEENDQDLEPILEYLMARESIEIEDNKRYAPTEKGREVLLRFMRRYHDFLRHYDVYSAVDMGEGEFAFKSYFDYDHENSGDEAAWRSYLSEERWEDLRVAVAAFKKLNPVEIVFMSFLNEGRFGLTSEGWQFDLLLGTVWDEILEVCNTALSIDDLGYEDDDGAEITGEAVIKDVISQGARLNMKLKKKEAELYGDRDESAAADDEEESQKVRVEDDGYEAYEHYYDPYYISPCWGTVIFF
jgi:DNA-binding PadR family transcriptional regulator